MRRRYFNDVQNKAYDRNVLCTSITDRDTPVNESVKIYTYAYKDISYDDFTKLPVFSIKVGEKHGGIMGATSTIALKNLSDDTIIATAPDGLNGYIKNFEQGTADYLFCLVGEKFEIEEGSSVSYIKGEFIPISEW